MNSSHRILCGGCGPTTKIDPKTTLRLNLWGGKEDENVQLRIEDLHRALYRNIPQQFFDLVEIAAYIYCADQALKRTGQDADSFGSSWRRNLDFHIPVRCIKLWSRSDVIEVLREVLGFLSDDSFTFQFYPAKQTPTVQQYLGFNCDNDIGRDFERVVMFSGGLDSLSGAIEETLGEKNRVVLVTHESTSKNAKLLRELQESLAEKAKLLKPLHVRVRANKKKKLGKEYTQRTRSFLFASFGVTVAKMMGLESLRFYENGVVSVNLPVSAQVIGSRATRTTHPRTLSGFQKLFSILSDSEFRVDNPFLWTTKAEVISKIVKASCGDMIVASSSCAHTWTRTNAHTHCGVCSQCIDRRLAVAAAHAEHFDPVSRYHTDIFVDPSPVDEDKMMLAAYLDRATAVGEISTAVQFIETFPEIVDTFPYVPGGPTKAVERFLDLYKRHAKEVNEALESVVRANTKALVQGNGGGHLIRVLLERRVMEVSALAKPGPSEIVSGGVMEFRGADWCVTIGSLVISVPELTGMRYIAILFGNPGAEFRHSDLHLRGNKAGCPEVAAEALRSNASRGIPSTDEKAISAVKRRLQAVVEEQAYVRATGDMERLHDLEDEKDELEKYLSSTTNKEGKPRKTKGIHESVRVSVVKAISTVRNRLEKSTRNAPLLEHLRAIRPGQGGHLVYLPKAEFRWQIFGHDP